MAGYTGNITVAAETVGFQAATAQVAALEAQLKVAQGQLATLGQGVGGSGANSFSERIRKHQLALRMFGHDAQMVGQTIFRWVTLPMGVVSIVSAKMAYDFNVAMTKIQALTGATTKEMQSYNTAVLELSKTTGVMPTDVAEGLYFIASSGFKGAEALKILNQAVKLTASGMGEMRWVSETLTSAMTAWGKHTLTAASAADTLVAAVREGKAEPDEFARSLGRVIPVASQIGIKFAEVGAAIASVTRIGMSARISTFGLRTLLTSFTKPQKPLIDGLKAIGMTVNEVYKNMTEKGFLPAMREIYEKTNGSAKKITRMFTQNGATIFLALMRDYKGTQGVFDRLLNRHGDAQRAFLIAMKSPAAQFRVALAGLAVAAIELGAKLLPIFTRIVGWVGGIANWFNGLSSNTQAWIGKLLLAASALGVILTVAGKVATVMTSAAAMKLLAGGATQTGIFSKFSGAASTAAETAALNIQVAALEADAAAAAETSASQIALAGSMQAAAAAATKETAALRAATSAALPKTPLVPVGGATRISPAIATGAYSRDLARRAAVDISSALIPVYQAEKAASRLSVAFARSKAVLSSAGRGIGSVAKGIGTSLMSIGAGFTNIIGGIGAFLGVAGSAVAVIAALGAGLLILKLRSDAAMNAVATPANIKSTTDAIKNDTGGKLQDWADRVLGGRLVVTKGELVWQPRTTVRPINVDGLVKWVKTASVETQRKIVEEGIEQERVYAAVAARVALRAAKQAELGAGMIRSGKGYAGMLGPDTQARAKAQEAAYMQEAATQRGYYAKMVTAAQTFKTQLAAAVGKTKVLLIQAKITDMKGSISLAKAQLKTLSDKPWSIKTEIKKDQLRQDIAKLEGRLKQFTGENRTVLITAKIEAAQSRVEALKRILSGLKVQAAHGIDVSAKITKVEAALKTATAKHKALVDRKDKITVDANVRPAIRGIFSVAQALAALPTTKTITVTTENIVVGHGGRHSGGTLTGPHSGYTATLHGRELILPLDHPQLIPDLLARAGLAGLTGRAAPNMGRAASNAGRAAPSSPTGVNVNALRAGARVATDFANGIKSKQQKVIEAAAALAANVLSVLESAIGIGTAIGTLKESGLPSMKVVTVWAKKVSVRMAAMIKVMQKAFKSIDIGKASKGDKNGVGEITAGWKAEAFGSVVSMAEGIGSIFTTFSELTTEKIDAAIISIKAVKSNAKKIGIAIAGLVKAILASFNKTLISEFTGASIGRAIEMANSIAGIITTFAELTQEGVQTAVDALIYVSSIGVITPLVGAIKLLAGAVKIAFDKTTYEEPLTTAASAAVQMTSDIAGIITTFSTMTEKMVLEALAGLGFVGTKMEPLTAAILTIINQFAIYWGTSEVKAAVVTATSAAAQLVSDLANIITTFATMTEKTVKDAISGMGRVVTSMPLITPALLSVIKAMRIAFKDVVVSPEFAAASSASATLVSDITGMIGNLTSMTEKAITEAIWGAGWVAYKAQDLGKALKNMIAYLQAALLGIDATSLTVLQDSLAVLSDIAAKISAIVNDLAGMTPEQLTLASAAGASLGEGFYNGLLSWHQRIIEEAQSIASGAAAALGGTGGGYTSAYAGGATTRKAATTTQVIEDRSVQYVQLVVNPQTGRMTQADVYDLAGKLNAINTSAAKSAIRGSVR